MPRKLPGHLKNRDALTGTRPVAIIAFSRMKYIGKSYNRIVLFVEHLFVAPEWRELGIGHALLHDTVINDGGPSEDDRVALVVRKHSDQQSAARKLYKTMKLKAMPVRQSLYERDFSKPHPMRHPLLAVTLRPRYDGPREQREQYMEGYRDSALRGTRSWTHTSYTVARHSEHAPTFVKNNRRFMQLLKKHHDPNNGGDGADPYEVLGRAERVRVAYDTFEPPEELTR